jgi:S-adenosylmethionine/arginine decarboxylase-like enzyme
MGTNTMNKSYWGYHLILDCADGRRDAVTDGKHIAEFAKTLVKDIDMVAYGDPQVVLFGTGNKEGYTLVQLIETSNICGHFCSESGDLYLDVFSCKPYDKEVVKKLAYEYFGFTSMRETYLVRQA